jgi:hypothetical protein
VAASFRSAEFVSASALTMFVRNNPTLSITAIVGLPSGTFQVFGMIDLVANPIDATGLTLGAQGYKIAGQ